jgi:response regulator of citrate/malate metabolism
MTKKVLIVEDDMLISHLMDMYISKSDCCEVIGCVDNGEDAIEIAKNLHPDFILMDIRIGGEKDGIETATIINSDIPIIYASANSDEKTVDRAKKTKMLAFLVKPIIKSELLNILCSAQKTSDTTPSR